jgi:hypothetical protein
MLAAAWHVQAALAAHLLAVRDGCDIAKADG